MLFRSVLHLILLCALFFLAWPVRSEPYQLKLISVSTDSPVIVRPKQYDYVPTIVARDGVLDFWWCGGLAPGAGDMIFNTKIRDTELGDFSKPNNNFKVVFSNSKDVKRFDGRHVCDPSVVFVGGRGYMYYGGIPETKTKLNELDVVTKIGLAISDDKGETWKRVNNGQPLLVTRDVKSTDLNKYGIGQPSVIYHNNTFYLLYTNTVGIDGAGIYLLRSQKPLLGDIEEWNGKGFVHSSRESLSSGKMLIKGFSADWAYLKEFNVFMVALRKVEGVMQLIFFDEAMTTKLGEIELPIDWTEGPGLPRDDVGNLSYKNNSDGSITFSIFRSKGVKKQPATWDIFESKVTISIPK